VFPHTRREPTRTGSLKFLFDFEIDFVYDAAGSKGRRVAYATAERAPDQMPLFFADFAVISIKEAIKRR
jgi:hypothetical protein